MTEHKFTDEEVIRVLECCSNLSCVDYCPLKKIDHCESKKSIAALDLINRQRAEIEQLKHKYELSEAEREANVKGFAEVIATTKSEAVKEFAERLKTYYRHLEKTAGGLVEYHIDQIVKEMTNDAE